MQKTTYEKVQFQENNYHRDRLVFRNTETCNLAFIIIFRCVFYDYNFMLRTVLCYE